MVRSIHSRYLKIPNNHIISYTVLGTIAENSRNGEFNHMELLLKVFSHREKTKYDECQSNTELGTVFLRASVNYQKLLSKNALYQWEHFILI